MFHVKQIQKKTHITECPVCGNPKFSKYMETKDYFFTKEEFSLSICDGCSFVFTNPIPRDISRYYETEEYLSHHSAKKGIISSIYSRIRSLNIKRKYSLVTTYNSTGKILDIGCGTGELLSYFNTMGWKIMGIEPDENARQFAINTNKIEVGAESQINEITDSSYDVVSMWHVLEHVGDLNRRIEDVKRITKDNGTMFFALPNLNSPDAKKYGRHWSALDVPRHLYHFTQETFETLISKHGLELIHAEPMKFDAYYVSLLSEKYLNKKLPIISAALAGARSNNIAKKDNNYSSMVFVVKKKL